MNGGCAYTFAGVGSVSSNDVNASSSGSNTIVAADSATQRIVVMRYKVVVSSGVAVTWESSGGKVLDGPSAFTANGGESTSESPSGLFATEPGEDLVMNLSVGVQVGGSVKFARVG